MKSLSVDQQRTLLINAAQQLAKVELPDGGLNQTEGVLAGGGIDSVEVRTPGFTALRRFAEPDAGQIPDAEVQAAFRTVVNAIGGTVDRAVWALEELGKAPPDFMWTTADVHLSDRYQPNDPNLYLGAQILALAQIDRVPGLLERRVYPLEEKPKTDGFAGPAGSGTLSRIDLKVASGWFSETGSLWIESRDGQVVNGGWLTRVPEELRWFGCTDVVGPWTNFQLK